MIFALHAYSLLRDTIYSTIKKENCAIPKKTNHHESNVPSGKMNSRAILDEDGVRFSPPAYLQRYGDVCDRIQSDTRWAGEINKVVDFGCAELSLFTFLKRIGEINEVLEVDFDRELLERHCYKTKPLLYDYRIERTTPLNVSILQGSVADPDKRLIGCDAVVCIELIEHLDPATLDRFPQNIFGFIKPRLAFVTTPNVEFNVLFPKLKDGGFRHYDHRFEWTRNQFEEWANNIVLRYPNYEVEFYGIAEGPDGTEHLGCCSQMALFISKNYQKEESHASIKTAIDCDTTKTENGALQNECNREIHEPKSSSVDSLNQTHMPSDSSNEPEVLWDCKNWENDLNKEYYKLIAQHIYPFAVDSRSRDQIILDEAISTFNLLVGYDYDYFEESTEEWKVPLERLLPRLNDIPVEIEELRRIIIKTGRKVKGDYLIFESRHSYTSEEDDYNCSGKNDTDINHEQWTNLWADEPSWDEEPPPREAANDSPSEKQQDTSEKCAEYEISEYPIENTSIHSPKMLPNDIAPNHQTGIYTPLEMSESAIGDIHLLGSSTDDGSLLNSPLARFYVPNGSSADEQRLSDSGYLKSQQDSPQSPVCSDTFSNDLITPDKDEMQSTILECIPENLNCLSSTSKDVTRLRRKSIGPGIESKYPEFNDSASSSMSRPKSLNMCTISPKSEIDDSKRPNSVGSSRNRSNRQSCDEFRPWSPIPYESEDSQPNMIDMSPIDDGIEDAPMRQLLDLDPRNIDRRVADGFWIPERLIRPDFLDVQNVDFAIFQNGDRLNNNLDFEGNNFEGGEDADEFHFREGNIFQGEYMGDDPELLRLHLDRHNENHLILDQEIDRLVNEINHEIDHGEIVEDILEYRENNEANENEGFYKGPSNGGIINDLPETSSSKLNVNKTSPKTGTTILEIKHKIHRAEDKNETSGHISNQDKESSSVFQISTNDYDNMTNIVNFQAGCSNYADNNYEASFNNPGEFNMLSCNGMIKISDGNNLKTDCNISEIDLNSLSDAFINNAEDFESVTNIWGNQSDCNDSWKEVESYDDDAGCSFSNRLRDDDQEYDTALSLTYYNRTKCAAKFLLSQMNITDEDSDHTVTSSRSDFDLSIDSILPDWLFFEIQERNDMEILQVAGPPPAPLIGPVEEPTEWGAFGDGPGVHSITVSTSSGNSSGSVGDDPQIEPLDLFWVSSGGSMSNNSTPVRRNHHRLYDESSSSASDTNTRSQLPSVSTTLSDSSCGTQDTSNGTQDTSSGTRDTSSGTQDISMTSGSTHSSRMDLGNSSTQSDGSGNIADIEVDSESN